ncbi:SAF domain-containing protein [Gordonia sp. PKS22-38]|uniref:SAF domain-containing protein n=1 Tax=Gordonia prachuapensis TaxID=3115651 RepID=A0ABU7MWY9_9ACTN|nr:SAF domain-containing protein [Gordonia sp. PKS22-38]
MRGFLRNELSPRVVDRVRHTLRPGWARSVVIRRAAAIVLVLCAVGATVVGHRSEQSRAVVVAARDLTPGHAISADDLAVTDAPGEMIPTGAVRLTADALGRTLVGRIRAGEILTDVRLLSPALPAQLTGRADARLVPVRLADETVASVLREGDVVDVLTAPDAPASRQAVLATGAIVALTSHTEEAGGLASGRSGARPILLAMSEDEAHDVAAVGLDGPLTVVVH